MFHLLLQQLLKSYLTLFRVHLSIERQEINPANSHKTVDDSGKPAHASENHGDEVKIEKSNQSPVYSSDNRNGQRRIFQKIISHKSPSFPKTRIVCLKNKKMIRNPKLFHF